MAPRPAARPADPRAAEHGFSLIEVLIALTLFAILMAMLSGGVRLGSRIEASGSEQINEWSQIAAVQRFLRAELATAQAPQTTRTAANIDPYIVFDGEPDRLAFIGLLPDQFLVGGLQTITLAPVLGRSGAELRAAWQFYDGGPVQADPVMRADTVGENEAVLLDQVSGVEFGYFGQRDPLRPAEWGDRWDVPNRVPSLVRVRMKLKNALVPPELVIALPAALSQR
jgi:general secretion pathway protein J